MNAQRSRMTRGVVNPMKSDSETLSQPPLIGLCRKGAFSPNAWIERGIPLEVIRLIERLRLEVFRSGKPVVEEISVDQGNPDFRDRVYECVLAPVPTHASKIDTILVTVRDISAARHAEESIRESERQYRLLAENSTDVITRHDPAGNYLYISPSSKAVFGYEPSELIGRSGYDFIHPDDLVTVGRSHSSIMETSDLVSFVLRFRRKDGNYIWVETATRSILDEGTGRVVEIQASTRDVTARHRAEELLKLQNCRLEEVARSERHAHETLKQAEVQLVQSEKLSALGHMVAGVAHEINNPLAFVNNNITVLQRDTESLRTLVQLYQQADSILETHAPGLIAQIREHSDDVDLPYILENIERLTARSREGLRRIQQIVKDLREFARLDDGDLQAVDLNIGIQSTLNMIDGQAKKKGVELKAELEPLPLVTCYPGKINQVLMNLIANAIDACSTKGAVRVSSRVEADGEAVLISVEDNGSGIDPKIRERIFDPFFTTKPIGQGTGLGLSISYGIVKAQGGTICVDSQPSRGSSFTVRLPTTPQVPLKPATPPAETVA